MMFTPEEKSIICIYNTSSREELIAELKLAVEHIEDRELYDKTQYIINKLNFMSNEEFEAEDFASDFDIEK